MEQKAYTIFRKCCNIGNLEQAKWIYKNLGIDLHKCYDDIAKSLTIFKWFEEIETVDVKLFFNIAIKQKNLVLIEYLISNYDIVISTSEFFSCCVLQCSIRLMNLIFSNCSENVMHIDTDNDSSIYNILQYKIFNGDIEMVKWLYGKYEFDVREEEILELIVNSKNLEIFKYLYDEQIIDLNKGFTTDFIYCMYDIDPIMFNYMYSLEPELITKVINECNLEKLIKSCSMDFITLINHLFTEENKLKFPKSNY